MEFVIILSTLIPFQLINAAQDTGAELQYQSQTGCLLSPILFNIFLERIMCETLTNPL